MHSPNINASFFAYPTTSELPSPGPSFSATLTHFRISLEWPMLEPFLSGVPMQLDLSRVCGPRSRIMVEVAVAMTATASRTLASML